MRCGSFFGPYAHRPEHITPGCPLVTDGVGGATLLHHQDRPHFVTRVTGL